MVIVRNGPQPATVGEGGGLLVIKLGTFAVAAAGGQATR